MQVPDGMGDLGGLGPDFVGGTNNCALLHAATGEKHRHRISIVAATESVNTSATVVVRSASELAGPDDEGFIKHPLFLEILDESGDRFIDTTNSRGMAALEVIVTVPATGKYLHKAK